MHKLSKPFYNRNTLIVAQELLGKFLVHNCNGKKYIGMITETEAYIGFDDKASHASKGKTKRNYPMFETAGIAYIYMIYGMYFCFNIVTEKKDFPAAVLIRALKPIKNISSKTDGPGKLCREMNIDKNLNCIDICGNILYVENHDFKIPKKDIIADKRIGIDYAQEYKDKLWRFYIK